MTEREVAEKLGISKGLAHQIMVAKGAPNAEKFTTEASYLKRLCRNALNKGHTHDALLLQAGKDKAPKADAPARPPAPVTEPETPAEPGDLAEFTASLSNLRQTVTNLGKRIAESSNIGTADLPLLDRFAKLQQELRQSEKHYLELQQSYAAIYPREDAQRAAIQIWITFRSAIDTIIGRLADTTNLPTWITEAGGTLPDDPRAFHHALKARIRELVTTHVNQMAGALARAAVPEGMPADAPKAAMIAELQRTIEALT